MALTKVDPTVVDDQVFGGRRLNINGDMRVAQRGTKTSMQNGYGGCDRINLLSNALGVYTLSQSDTSPNNFGKSFKLTTTTANTSPGASAYVLLQYKFEGHDLQSLKWGTADAEQITASFWVYTNKTGTYNLEMYAYDNTSNHQASKQYTVSASNTWEKKVITFPSGNNATIPDDNTPALNFNFWLGAGTTYSSGSASDGNFHSTTANRAAGNVNIADSTSNAFRITGLQIETGTQATPFEYRNIAQEEEQCRRYFQFHNFPDSAAVMNGCLWSATSMYGTYHLYPKMRAEPTTTISAGATFDVLAPTGQLGHSPTDAYAQNHSNQAVEIYLYRAAGLGTQSDGVWVRSDTSGGETATFTFDAEL
jgi:hypothetical protein